MKNKILKESENLQSPLAEKFSRNIPDWVIQHINTRYNPIKDKLSRNIDLNNAEWEPIDKNNITTKDISNDDPDKIRIFRLDFAHDNKFIYTYIPGYEDGSYVYLPRDGKYHYISKMAKKDIVNAIIDGGVLTCDSQALSKKRQDRADAKKGSINRGSGQFQRYDYAKNQDGTYDFSTKIYNNKWYNSRGQDKSGYEQVDYLKTLARKLTKMDKDNYKIIMNKMKTSIDEAKDLFIQLLKTSPEKLAYGTTNRDRWDSSWMRVAYDTNSTLKDLIKQYEDIDKTIKRSEEKGNIEDTISYLNDGYYNLGEIRKNLGTLSTNLKSMIDELSRVDESFRNKMDENLNTDIDTKAKEVVNPVYADAIKGIKRADKAREEYRKLPKAEVREEKPKFKGTPEMKKMHLSESLFEEATENTRRNNYIGKSYKTKDGDIYKIEGRDDNKYALGHPNYKCSVTKSDGSKYVDHIGTQKLKSYIANGFFKEINDNSLSEEVTRGDNYSYEGDYIVQVYSYSDNNYDTRIEQCLDNHEAASWFDELNQATDKELNESGLDGFAWLTVDDEGNVFIVDERISSFADTAGVQKEIDYFVNTKQQNESLKSKSKIKNRLKESANDTEEKINDLFFSLPEKYTDMVNSIDSGKDSWGHSSWVFDCTSPGAAIELYDLFDKNGLSVSKEYDEYDEYNEYGDYDEDTGEYDDEWDYHGNEGQGAFVYIDKDNTKELIELLNELKSNNKNMSEGLFDDDEEDDSKKKAKEEMLNKINDLFFSLPSKYTSKVNEIESSYKKFTFNCTSPYATNFIYKLLDEYIFVDKTIDYDGGYVDVDESDGDTLLDIFNEIKAKSEAKTKSTKSKVESLNEGFYRGVPGVELIYHGEWGDPELSFTDANGKTYIANYYTIEDGIYQYYKELGAEQKAQGLNSEFKFDDSDEDFNRFVQSHADMIKSDIIDFGREVTDEACKSKKRVKKQLKEDSEIHVFDQIPDEDIYDQANYVFDDDGLYGRDYTDGLIIGGNRDYSSMIYSKEHKDEIKELLYSGYSSDEIVQELNKITGKTYVADQISGYSQSDWNNIYYPAGEFSNDYIRGIEDAYFSKYTAYDDGNELVVVFDSDRRPVKEIISDQTGIPVNQIKIRKFTGYTRTPNYEDDED